MGTPLAPALANIFMGFHESNWLNEYSLNKPKFYLIYLGDILAAFDNEQGSLNFLDFLNNRYPNSIVTRMMYSFQVSQIILYRTFHKF